MNTDGAATCEWLSHYSFLTTAFSANQTKPNQTKDSCMKKIVFKFLTINNISFSVY